ncbi:MAG TPA: hypothetical protein VFQ39_08590 [Longimicrobium sp.]|nr:hypothetical protein [Longimicrobium sp.]
MRRITTFLSLGAALACCPALRAQTYETVCPTHLSPRFPGYTYVAFQGYRFDTSWYAVSTANPLGSLEWYRPPSTNPHPISRDGTVRWQDAEVQVHCWFYRDAFIFARHLDPVAFRGRIRPVEHACGSGGPGAEVDWGTVASDRPVRSADDPAADECANSGEGGASSGTGGGGAVCGGGAVDQYEYVCIDILNPATGQWEEVWCGVIAVCAGEA